jgi:hypothetical protein
MDVRVTPLLTVLHHHSHAMMLSIPPATRWQAGSTLCSHGEERRCKRQA